MTRHHWILIAVFLPIVAGTIAVAATYLPTARESIEELGAYLLISSSVTLFAGVLLLTSTRTWIRWLAAPALVSVPFQLFLAYVFMTRW